MGLRTVLVLAIAVTLAVARPVFAQTAIERHLGTLGSTVTPGNSGAWIADADSQWFKLSNVTDARAIRYYWIGLVGGLSSYGVSLKMAVRARGTGHAFGGILFDFEDGPSYFAFTIGSDNSVKIFFRDENGIEQNVAEGISARGDGSDVLRALVLGDKTVLQLNDETAFTVNSENGFAPRVGVFATGTGVFGFTEFKAARYERPTGGLEFRDEDTPGAQNTLPELPGSSFAEPPPLPVGNVTEPPPLPGEDPQFPPPIPGQSATEPPPIPGFEQGSFN